MLSKVTLFTTAIFIASAVAGSNDAEVKCTTGPVQCCQHLHKTDSNPASAFLGLVGVTLQDLSANVGFLCSPITVIGAVTGSECANSPVCCKENNIKGIVSTGCMPISGV